MTLLRGLMSHYHNPPKASKYCYKYYHKDIEPLYNSFMYSPTTSFQYLSIQGKALIDCYNCVKRSQLMKM